MLHARQERGHRDKPRAVPPWLVGMAVWLLVSVAHAHPHAFVDGGVDFVIGERTDGPVLEALHVTWYLDEFESLYMLSAAKVDLNAEGVLDGADRDTFRDQMQVWLNTFDGSAHARVAEEPIALTAPQSLEVAVVDGRLKMTFNRPLAAPLALAGVAIDVGFYERTYFYAHSVTQPSRMMGAAAPCEVETVPYDPDNGNDALQETLSRLGREDVPADLNVGTLFADRIILQCA